MGDAVRFSRGGLWWDARPTECRPWVETRSPGMGAALSFRGPWWDACPTECSLCFGIKYGAGSLSLVAAGFLRIACVADLLRGTVNLESSPDCP